MLSWIKVSREKNKILSYGSCPPPRPPVDSGVSTANPTAAGVSLTKETEEGEKEAERKSATCLLLALLPPAPPCSLPSWNCLGPGSKRPAAGGLALGFYVVEGHCRREEGLHCVFKVAV